jgi:hypothetical protein
MRHVLHLIRDPANRTALDVMARQARDPEVRLSVVLLHEAAGADVPAPTAAEVFCLDGGSRGAPASASPYPRVSHAQLLDLIFAADTVVTW